MVDVPDEDEVERICGQLRKEARQWRLRSEAKSAGSNRKWWRKLADLMDGADALILRLASRPTQGRKVREALEGALPYLESLAEAVDASPQSSIRALIAKTKAALSTPLDPPEAVHRSDCAVHNEPPRPCDCHLFDPNIDPPENSATVETVCAYEAGLAEGRVKGLELAAKVADAEYDQHAVVVGRGGGLPSRDRAAVADRIRVNIRNLIQSSQGGDNG